MRITSLFCRVIMPLLWYYLRFYAFLLHFYAFNSCHYASSWRYYALFAFRGTAHCLRYYALFCVSSCGHGTQAIIQTHKSVNE